MQRYLFLLNLQELLERVGCIYQEENILESVTYIYHDQGFQYRDTR
jgi:hypothetical protein